MSEEISKKCSANGCDKKSKKNGFCLHHDYKNKRYGDPNHIVVRPIAKTKSPLSFTNISLFLKKTLFLELVFPNNSPP